MLTKEEILKNWNMPLTSQATNYGDDLIRATMSMFLFKQVC